MAVPLSALLVRTARQIPSGTERLEPGPVRGGAVNEESLFAAALGRSNPAERRAFVDGACSGDSALRHSLDQLLAADEQTGGILERTPDGCTTGAFPDQPLLAAERVFAG